ncbi:MAG TPA: TRAP transporter large permease subunit, partial [Rhizobiaceae bacterium]|nr:TRAP transporter large permease subunit [Rhizobiaceae bacterium]
MTPEIISVGAVVVFIALILIEVPVAFALLIAGGLGVALLADPFIAFTTIASAPYSAVAKYDLLILPMFILLGAIVANAGIASRIFAAANYLVGWLPGGLGITTVVACTIFGGISGSSVADAATLGKVSIGEMRAHGYSARFSAGLVAASGMIAILIPPS